MSRSYVVPRHVRETSVWFDDSATMDEIELAAQVLPQSPAGVWARSVVSRAVERATPLIAAMEGADGTYWGYGDDDVITAVSDVADGSDLIPLTAADAVAVNRMLSEGAESVLVRPYAPVAIIRAPYGIAAAADAPTGAQAPVELPDGTRLLAIVDDVDKTAVLDLIALAPGPHLYRRHDSNWFEDEGWITVLKGVRPPSMVDLSSDEKMQQSVTQQVDEATVGQPFKPLKKEDKPVQASAYLEQARRASDAVAIQIAITAAVDVGELKAPVATERLRQYWLHGKGAAKIRWGTPGAWTRCHRLLSKYMPPYMVPGYCTNLSQRLGGPGIATHVGDVKPGAGLVSAGFQPSQKRREDGEWTADGQSTKRNTISGKLTKQGRPSRPGRADKSSNALAAIAEMMKADPDARKFFEAARKMTPAQRRALRQVKKQQDEKALEEIAKDIERGGEARRAEWEKLARLSDLERHLLQKMYRQRQTRARQRRA